MGYCQYRYDTNELQAMVNETKQQQQRGEGSTPEVGHICVGDCVYAFTTSCIMYVQHHTIYVHVNVYRIHTHYHIYTHTHTQQVWTSLVQWYIDQRSYYEDKVKEFAEPPSDKLLPDLPPQLKYVGSMHCVCGWVWVCCTHTCVCVGVCMGGCSVILAPVNTAMRVNMV